MGRQKIGLGIALKVMIGDKLDIFGKSYYMQNNTGGSGATESFHIDGKIIEIPRCVVVFDKWTGEPVQEAFGCKPILNVYGRPVFAELGIMLHFQNDGLSVLFSLF